ncbi:MAG: esterase-like activity of phytase family protein [Pseudomonadota bacterium]
MIPASLLVASAAALLGKPTEVTLDPFSGLADGLPVGCMTMTSGYTLRGPRGFGGYSGMAFDAETGRLTLLSDGGHIAEAQLELTPEGAVTAMTDVVRFKIEIPPRKDQRNDAEGIAPYQDGWLVSRERDHDAIYVTKEDGKYVQQAVLANFARFASFPSNTSLEAVTAVGDGAYLFISEAQNGGNRALMFTWDGEETQRRASYQGEPDFDVTDIIADRDGDRLYILERAFSPKLGPRARIKVARLSDFLDAAPREKVTPQRLGAMSFLEGADNMEGIAVYKAHDGSTNLMLVSDDNFRDLQRTVLMTLRINEGCPLSATQP